MKNEDEEGRGELERQADLRRVQEQIDKLRRMQEDLLMAAAEESSLDEEDLRAINNEINRKMDALLLFLERQRKLDETASSPPGSPKSPDRQQDERLGRGLFINKVKAIRMREGQLSPRVRSRSALPPRLLEELSAETKKRSDEPEKNEAKDDPAKSGVDDEGDLRLSPKAATPRQRLSPSDLQDEDEQESAVEAVTIKRWMTKQRNRPALAPMGESPPSEVSESEHPGVSDAALEVKTMTPLASPLLGRKAQLIPVLSENGQEIAVHEDSDIEPTGTAARRARSHSLLDSSAVRIRSNTDLPAGSNGVHAEPKRRWLRRGSLGSEISSDEDWNDMLHSLGVTVQATKRLLKKEAKARRKRLERKLTQTESGDADAGDDQLEDKDWIVFVNHNSGGKNGKRIMNRFLELLPHDQVYSLIDDKGPDRGFARWLQTPHYRMVVCGGDGTANWVLTALDKFIKVNGLTQSPPVGVIPLGTGNDLARACGWGSSFKKCERLPGLMRDMSKASVDLFDRWKVSVEPLTEEGSVNDCDPYKLPKSDYLSPKEEQSRHRRRRRAKSDSQPYEHTQSDTDDEAFEASRHRRRSEGAKGKKGEEKGIGRRDSEIGLDEELVRDGMQTEERNSEYMMNNYFSIGVDAEIVLRFHQMREHHKELFRNVLINKGWYFRMSAKTAKHEKKRFKDFRDHLEVRLWHGEEQELLHIDDKRIKSIIVMNIATYGGARCWRADEGSNHEENKHVIPAIGDGVLEVVGMRGVAHLGAIVTGVSEAIKLGQATRIEIVTKREFPAHVDGEPWILRPCRITFELHNQACLLMRPECSPTI